MLKNKNKNKQKIQGGKKKRIPRSFASKGNVEIGSTIQKFHWKFQERECKSRSKTWE